MAKNEEEQTKVVHVTRPANPEKQVVDGVTKLKHERSVRAYPELNLTEGEHVVHAIERHPIGLFAPVVLCASLISLSFLAALNYGYIQKNLLTKVGNPDPFAIIIPIILFTFLVILVTYVAYYVYSNNKLFLTNESIIQEVQTSLFSHSEQTVSLGDIEDVSYIQDSILEQMFNFGSIKLCTEGEGTTFIFTYAANPKSHASKLGNAVDAYKNGRPVEN